MSKIASADPASLVKTQAERVPSPGPTVPEPPGQAQQPDLAGVIHRLKELAREVGGMSRLRQLIDEIGEA